MGDQLGLGLGARLPCLPVERFEFVAQVSERPLAPVFVAPCLLGVGPTNRRRVSPLPTQTCLTCRPSSTLWSALARERRSVGGALA